MIVDDFKYGWRQLLKAPGFTITAVMTLGLAIGANTAVFSLVDAVLLKSIPYPNPERLGTMGAIYTRSGAEIQRGGMAITGAGWKALQGRVPSVDAAVYSGLSSAVSLVTPSRTFTGRLRDRLRHVGCDSKLVVGSEGKRSGDVRSGHCRLARRCCNCEHRPRLACPQT